MVVAAGGDIQAAIDAAEAATGPTTVVLGRGTHTVSISQANQYALVIDSSDVELRIPAGATLKLADNDLGAGETGFILQVGDGTNAVSGVKVTGPGTIDGNSANNTSPARSSSPVRSRCSDPTST